jgi:HAE1 family hydrophobic/amphiphilic exporter-1
VIEQILRRPVSVAVATVAACALGLMSLFELPLSLLPSIERPKLVVEAKAANGSRDELLHEVTGPIERRLSSVPGITSIESETSDGLARIEIGSAWQTDPDRLRIDVARRIEGATSLPLDDLTIDVAGSDVSPVIEVAVAGASGATRTRVAERVVLPELARVEGAGKIEVIGARPLRVVVQPRAAALIARGLTALDVEERVRSAGSAIDAGRVREGASVRPLVVTQPINSLDDLRALQVSGVPLGEIADVTLREIADETMFRTERGEAVLLRVHRAPNANAVALARGVRKRIEELSARAAGVQLSVARDHSREVTRALAELALAALLGVLLGTLVLRFMLGVWRPTLALALVVPAALLASFSAFYFAGIQLDVISLAGLALATGLLVDNSIVVLESIESLRVEQAGRRASHERVAAGTRQVMRAVIASSITLMIVFAPLLYLRGLARALFGEQAMAVVASVAASLLLSLTLTPVLAQRDEMPTRPRSPGRDAYLRLFSRVEEMPARVIVAAVGLLIGAFALAALLPRELFARGSSDRVLIEARLAPDLNSEAARALGNSLWDAIAARQKTLTQRENEITVEATPDARLTRAIAGVRTTIRPKPSTFIEAISGNADEVELIVSAATPSEATSLAQRVDNQMRSAGFARHDEDLSRARPAMILRWNETLPLAERREIERQARAALTPADVGQTAIARAETPILLEPVRPASLSLVPVRTAGRVVPLTALSGVAIAERTPAAMRDQGRPAHRVTYRSGRHSTLPALEAAGTERIRVAGHARELADAFAQMRVAFLLAAILLYLTVAAFYESLTLPLLVMAALPFAGAGGLLALLATGQSLNVMSLIGLVFLGGVVVNHTVVLLDRAEQLRRAGHGARAAIRSAVADRYRPVIMTTITAMLGMVPLAILGGPGVELRRAVAVAVTGGLITATIGTLLVIPVLYRVFETAHPSPLPARREEVEEEAVA